MTSSNEDMPKFDWKLVAPKEDALVIQLGSNDGRACEEYGLPEYLKENNNIAILVEPLKKEFLDLVVNYSTAKSRLFFENLAIAHDKGTGQARLFLDGVESSLVRKKPDNENFDVVRVETFQYLIDKYKLTKIDGIFIDIEGLEYEVIKHILEDCKIKPDFFRFEYILSEEQELIDLMLRDHDYKVCLDMTHRGDKVAVKKEIYERLSIL